jgi:MFS transporter, DHA2 family, multidrug resistance protein
MQKSREFHLEHATRPIRGSDTASSEASAASTQERWKPSFNPWIVTLTVTLATFMEVLDTSIANVALPHIAGSLAASQSEAIWVISSYLIANAVSLPLSGYLAAIIGRKRFYMLCVAVFGISSLFCGISLNLGMLLFFRVLQGVGGGGLQTSEQAILADIFEPAQLGQAFAVYGFAVVVPPAIGPLVGGWVTDNYSWRWLFFLNVPVTIISLILTNRFVEDPPHLKRERDKTPFGKMRVDYLGFALVTLVFGSLEVFLDKGQEDDWFGSHFITTMVVIFVISFLAAHLGVFADTAQAEADH